MDWVYYDKPVYNFDVEDYVVAYSTETSVKGGVYTYTISYLLRGEVKFVGIKGEFNFEEKD